jgi:hypothetical protein
MDEFSLELLDLALLRMLEADWPSLKSRLGLVEHLFDPVVDLAWLSTKLIGKVRDGFLAAEVPPNDLCFFGWREVLACLVRGT